MKIALLMLLAGSALAQTPAISLHIETASGKTEFRMGEAIGLKLTFENSSAEEWMIRGVGSGRSMYGLRNDGFLVTPKEGTADPRFFELREGHGGSGPGGMGIGVKQRSTNVDLNEWGRFDRAGRYRVSGAFHANSRLQPQGVAVNSNEIEIEVVPPTREWLAEQLRQAVAILDAPAGNDPQTYNARGSAVRAIWYLDTPESVREAARLLGTLDEQTGRPLVAALRGSAHQAAAIAAMNQLLRLADQPVTARFIQTLALMEAAQRFPLPVDRDAADPDGGKRSEVFAATEQQLRTDLAGVVGRKRGAAKAVSLATVISGERFESVTETRRNELAAGFMDLPWQQQEQLLNGQWRKIEDPAMIPALRQIYDSPSQAIFQSLAPVAVQRLYELDPARTRTLILDDMRRDTPRLPFATLAVLSDATLPEMDDVLLEHLRHDKGVDLIARYATANILDGVKEWYAKQDGTKRWPWAPDRPDIGSSACQPALVGYFLRVDPVWGERVLRDLLNDRSLTYGGCWNGILGRTAKYHAGPAWEKVAIDALTDTVVAVKSDAVKALGEYGSAAAQQKVMDAFRFWHDWWKDKPAEMVAEGQFEQAFFEAAVRGESWIANGEALEKVRDFCITAGCRQQAEEYIRVWQEAVPVSIGESPGGDVSVSFAQYYPRSFDAARTRLLQLPAGTRMKWSFNIKHTPEIDSWVAAMDRDLAGRGVVISGLN
jgi:hypothetical protein